MSNSEFARSQLHKHGWENGKGLGRSENGIKSALKVKLKNNTNGLGHNQGDEFTFHWWDHIFNKTANSIKVFSTEDGDKIEKDLDAKKIMPSFVSSKKPLKSCYAGKPLLYGSFVKAGTLKEEEEYNKVMLSDGNSDSDLSESENIITTDTLEKTFKLTGLTGHKAARHGFKLSGKLKRIQEQESSLKEVSLFSIPPMLKESAIDIKVNNSPVIKDKICLKKRKFKDENILEVQKLKVSKKKKSKTQESEYSHEDHTLTENISENTENILSRKNKTKKKKT